MINTTKKNALEYCAIKDLPKMITIDEKYQTRAILLVDKIIGGHCYCIGKWDDVLQKSIIIKDFFPQGGMVKEIISVFPLIEKKQEKKQDDFSEYTLDGVHKLFDDANISYPNNKKNDKKWLITRYKTVMAGRNI